MIEGLKGATRQSTPSLTGDSDQTVESLALAGAAAIQHLITERDSLRGRARAHDDELISLRAANEDLRRHLTLIRDHYLGLATGVVTELNQIDQFFQAALQGSHEVASGPEDSSLISLAERLSPNGKRGDRAVEAH